MQRQLKPEASRVHAQSWDRLSVILLLLLMGSFFLPSSQTHRVSLYPLLLNSYELKPSDCCGTRCLSFCTWKKKPSTPLPPFFGLRQTYQWKKVAGQQTHESSYPCLAQPSRWWKRHATGVLSSDGRPAGTPAERLHQGCLSPGWCCVLPRLPSSCFVMFCNQTATTRTNRWGSTFHRINVKWWSFAVNST